ncbi:MAG TPA: MgtC/SapB family protein [Phototrophicaceae bacterium]|nr:MgtC/SapB family protein [Phototrophicaceae bacterium]
MPLDQQFVAVFQLILAIVLGGLIGLDRERHQHNAGLRTHMLVCVGACLFTVLSKQAFPGGDPSRVASQILPGIGFLGAGTILKYGRNIRGLTTATSIWVTAAVGMAVGAGAWFLALCGTLLVWFVLAIIHRFEEEKQAHMDTSGESEPSVD